MIDLAALVPILVNVVLPVFLIAGVGFAGRQALAIDPQPVARLSLYLLLPSLLFQTVLTTQMGREEIGRIGAYVLLLTVVLVGLAALSARAIRTTRSEAAGLTVAITLMNAANYGLPVTLFAFGQDGFDRAVVFVIAQNIFTFNVAVFVAARGRLPWGQALTSVFRMPVLWATALALLIRFSGFSLPLPIERAVAVLSAAAIPVVILLLGMQVAGMHLRQIGLPTFTAVGSRLVLSPVAGLVLIGLLGPIDLTAKVMVLEAAMPTAVNATLIASEFNAEPQLVSTICLLTTAVSLVTVTGWVAYLQTL